jgi:hypothetical protein
MNNRDREINDLVNKIVEAVSSLKVVLFHSAAKDATTAQRDYDFLDWSSLWIQIGKK